MPEGFDLAAIVFALSLVATFLVAWIGRRVSARDTGDRDLAGRGLNRWLVGLSAAATGNSGYIVTGAVGLGYVGGLQWSLIPLGWLLGDLLFWFLVPERLNRQARKAGATTLSEFLADGLSGRPAQLLRLLVAVILAVFLATYTSAQWLAGQKFVASAFGFGGYGAFLLFSVTIVAYSTLGGFRGSVYVDTMQAVVSLCSTVLALVFITSVALADGATFAANVRYAPADFFSLAPHGQYGASLGVLFGFAAAGFGFSLSQPQVITRYFAGSSPEETRSARWIYIGFIQVTWLSMTVFGAVLRGVMPGLEDPEAGLVVFFDAVAHPIVAGLVFAYIYAIIGSTANSIVVAVSQSVRRDILPLGTGGPKERSTPFWIIGAVGTVTILLSFVLAGNVFSIATGAFSKMAAAIAAPVAIKVFGWRHDATSLTLAVLAGLAAAYAWEALGFAAVLNEAGVGMAVGVLANRMYCSLRQYRG